MKVCDSDIHKKLGDHCWLCNGTGKEKTIKETWSEGIIRKATKKVSKCGDCNGLIRIGESYFDTLERKNIFSTVKICNNCLKNERHI